MFMHVVPNLQNTGRKCDTIDDVRRCCIKNKNIWCNMPIFAQIFSKTKTNNRKDPTEDYTNTSKPQCLVMKWAWSTSIWYNSQKMDKDTQYINESRFRTVGRLLLKTVVHADQRPVVKMERHSPDQIPGKHWDFFLYFVKNSTGKFMCFPQVEVWRLTYCPFKTRFERLIEWQACHRC